MFDRNSIQIDQREQVEVKEFPVNIQLDLMPLGSLWASSVADQNIQLRQGRIKPDLRSYRLIKIAQLPGQNGL